MNAVKKKIKLILIFIVLSLILTGMLFLFSYIKERSGYLKSIQVEIEEYNKRIYESVQVIQKIEDSFKELENRGLSNICSKNVYLEIKDKEKIFIRCKKGNSDSNFIVDEINHGSYRSIIISQGSGSSKQLLTIEISDKIFLKLLDENIKEVPFIIIIKNNNKKINLKKNSKPSNVLQKEYYLNKNISYIIAYEESIILHNINKFKSTNIKNYIIFNVVIFVFCVFILFLYDKIVTNPYIRKIRLNNEEKEMLTAPSS
jgi:hypothetical protein